MGEAIGIPLTTFPRLLIAILQEVLFVVGVLHVSDLSLFSYRFWVGHFLFAFGFWVCQSLFISVLKAS